MKIGATYYGWIRSVASAAEFDFVHPTLSGPFGLVRDGQEGKWL
jgi:hypothetical protein